VKAQLLDESPDEIGIPPLPSPEDESYDDDIRRCLANHRGNDAYSLAWAYLLGDRTPDKETKLAFLYAAFIAYTANDAVTDDYWQKKFGRLASFAIAVSDAWRIDCDGAMDVFNDWAKSEGFASFEAFTLQKSKGLKGSPIPLVKTALKGVRESDRVAPAEYTLAPLESESVTREPKHKKFAISEVLTAIGSITMVITVLVGFTVVATLLIIGGVWLSATLLPILNISFGVVFLACLFVLVPLAFFHPTRGFAGIGPRSCPCRERVGAGISCGQVAECQDAIRLAVEFRTIVLPLVKK